eukprot:CAMPEP_0169332916 /NCGR_PEP_ID=MMETSP1017-20121227/14980_1 /TAXON_ID=342587 /ORGANISM="Karlodinium micrum, Strain CCMP2283" /LENGTH=155 /DNA_ID=CAMNT_0009428101 /DNA_START=519 /DNA_END=987 /DNA_ORIENTATION=-
MADAEQDKFREAVVLQEGEVNIAFVCPRGVLPSVLNGAPLLVEPPLDAAPDGSEVLGAVGETTDSKLAKAEHNLDKSMSSSSSAFGGVCASSVVGSAPAVPQALDTAGITVFSMATLYTQVARTLSKLAPWPLATTAPHPTVPSCIAQYQPVTRV